MGEYMDILNNLLAQLLSNPLVQGMILSAIKQALPIVLKQIDESGVEQQSKPWLEPTLIVLAGLVSAGDLFLHGQLSTVDPTALINWLQTFAQTYIGAKAAGTVHVEKAATAVSNVVNKNGQ